jgi:ATP-dependent helicase/nuclease subunit A
MTDVERAALTLLSDPVLSGWVQERLDVRVRHLLIDEFQDTNPLQWQALSSWLGSYAGARGSAPSVFIVGDPKQSIYRFRRAEPQVFKAAQAFVATVLGGDRLSCDHTRRNAQGVIATVNATMFAASAAGAFEGFRTHTTDSDAAGLVATLPPIARPEPDRTAGDPQEPTWRDSLTTPRELAEETLRTLEARQVAHWIAHRVQAGWLPGDVMVLSRRRAGLQPMQTELRALGIAAQIGEKTALGDCCEVQDVVALLDVLVSRQHDLSLARALKSPLFGLPDAALLELALRTARTASALVRTAAAALAAGQPAGRRRRAAAALAGMGPHLAAARRAAVHLHQWRRAGALCRGCASDPAPAVLANLRALLEATCRWRRPVRHALCLCACAQGRRCAGTGGGGDNAVRLLTVHGAKGLEARGVVLLDTDTPDRAADTMGVLVDWPGHVRAARAAGVPDQRAHAAGVCCHTARARAGPAPARRAQCPVCGDDPCARYAAGVLDRALPRRAGQLVAPARRLGLPALATPVPVSAPMVRHSRARPAP